MSSIGRKLLTLLSITAMLWAPLAAAQNGTLIVAVPATDAVFYIGEDTPAAIDALRTLARNVFSRAPNRLTETLLRWSDAGWEVVK